MNHGHDQQLAVWKGLPSPLNPRDTFDVVVRRGFWQHIQRHVCDHAERAAWDAWLGQHVTIAIATALSSPVQCAVDAASCELEKEARRSFGLPLVLLFRSGKTPQAAQTSVWRCLAVLPCGATFVSMETRKGDVVAATCYFTVRELWGKPISMQYRAVAARHVMTHCKLDPQKKVYLRPATNAIVRIPASQDDPFRVRVSFVTDGTWGFNGTGEWSTQGSVAGFQPLTPPKPGVNLRPRAQYGEPEGQP